MSNVEYWIAYNDPNDNPQIEDGPYGTYGAAMDRIEEMSNKEDYVILKGDFPDRKDDE